MRRSAPEYRPEFVEARRARDEQRAIEAAKALKLLREGLPLLVILKRARLGRLAALQLARENGIEIRRWSEAAP